MFEIAREKARRLIEDFKNRTELFIRTRDGEASLDDVIDLCTMLRERGIDPVTVIQGAIGKSKKGQGY